MEPAGKAPPPPEIGRRLRELRDETGQNQEEFAGRWKISARTYQSYERAESWPSGAFLRDLAESGYSVNWLLTGLGDARDAPQRLRLHNVEGGGLQAGTLDLKGRFRPFSGEVSEDEQRRLQVETQGMIRRMLFHGGPEELTGIDSALGHRLVDLHKLNAAHPRGGADSVGPLLSLIAMLDEAYEAAQLKISSADVAQLATDEYRAIYEGGDTIPERQTAARVARARHLRAATWAAAVLRKLAAEEGQN